MKRGIILDENELREVTNHLLTKDRFTFDIESYGEHRGVPHLAPISWISLAADDCGIVIPMGHPNGSKIIGEKESFTKYKTGKQKGQPKKIMIPVYDDPPPQLTTGVVFDILRPLFFNENIRKIGHGSITDFTAVTKYFGDVPLPPYGCTLIKQWLINENLPERELGLKALDKRYFKFEYDDENVGKCVEIHPFDKVAYYSYCDSVTDFWLDAKLQPQLVEQGLEGVYELEMGVLGALIGMQLRGINMNVEKINELESILSKEVIEKEAAVYKAAGHTFNINSNPQKQTVLYEEQGLKPWKLTKGGQDKKKFRKPITIKDYSTDDDVLASYPENAVASSLREYSDVNKLLTTYVYGWLGHDGEPGKLYDGHLHADFKQYGTVTGRFSCVSGDTLLTTSRGVFRMDDYIPHDTDLILTHEGNMKPVRRKIYKGKDKMFRVSCYSGNTIKCTADHRLFTPDGWKKVADLRPGDKIIGYDSFSKLYSEQRQYQQGTSVILREYSETDYTSGGERVRYFFPKRSHDIEGELVEGNSEKRTEIEIFSLENEYKESDVWKEWITSPQSSGRDIRWAWLSTDKNRAELCAPAPLCAGSSSGFGYLTDVARRSSHRRRSVQQQSGQLSSGNQEWTWETPFEEVEIREIAPVGTMGVWDIEVEGDHSYAAHGFLNHNCRAPNLQNIPRPYTEHGKLLRDIFIPESGGKLIVADYAQIELVVLAHYIGQGKLYEGFLEGIDPHTMTAAMVLEKDPADVTKVERQDLGKTLGFAVVYGAGLKKVANMAHIDQQEAKRVLAKHAQMFPEIYDFKDHVIKLTKSRQPQPYLTTLTGRRRRISGLFSSDEGFRMGAERQAFNSLIQGGAADLLKLSMVKVDSMLPPEISLRMTVHDELVLNSPAHLAEQGAAILKEAMTGPEIQSWVNVPLNVDIHIADKWSEAK